MAKTLVNGHINDINEANEAQQGNKLIKIFSQLTQT
jgi:hypothetical protein